jgi:uncharacterized membrane protein YeaQ/YmgE (transglycosylase-associated protein family)
MVKNKKFDLKALQKKGQASINGKMTALIGAVIVIFLVTALAPEMFTELAGLEVGGAPAWVETVLVVIVGAGLVFLIWRTFNNK